MRVLAVVLALLWAVPAVAEVSLSGRLEQGSLVLGRTEPGSRVSLDGFAVRVAPDGSFVIGFGRDAKSPARLSVHLPNGATEEHVLDIAPRDWPVQRIDGLPADKVVPDPQQLERIRDEAMLVAARRRRDSATAWFAQGFAAPTDGVVSGVFGSQRILNGQPRAPHSGSDIAAPAGAPVRAAAAGVVSLTADLFFTGQTVMIDHGHGLSSIYAHLSATAVREGDAVERGQLIGRVGASGRATGPHLHWGVSWFDQRLDPERVLALGRTGSATREE